MKFKATTKTRRSPNRRRDNLTKIVEIVTTFDEFDMRLALDMVRSIHKAPKRSRLHEREALRGGAL